MPSPRPTFDDVYRNQRQKLLRFARRLCRNSEDAEDVTQEAFARAFAAYGSFEASKPVENWLMRIAYNVFLDSERQKKRQVRTVSASTLPERQSLETVFDPSPSIDKQVANLDALERLNRELDRMGPGCREMFRKAYVEQVPFRTIAAPLGLPLPTIRSRLFRLRARLRQVLGSAADKNETQGPLFVG